MIDDYKYNTLNLPKKNEGLFGYGGKPNRNGIGFSGKVIDSSDAISVAGIGNIGPIGPDGEKGATGASGDLPSGIEDRGMLYYDGSNWTSLKFPVIPGFYLGRNILQFNMNGSGILDYNQPFLGGTLFGYRTEYNSWACVPSISEDQTFLVSDGGVLRSMAAYECGCTQA